MQVLRANSAGGHGFWDFPVLAVARAGGAAERFLAPSDSIVRLLGPVPQVDP